jgi:hypothetical protein
MRSSRESFGSVRDRFRLEEAKDFHFDFPDAHYYTPDFLLGGFFASELVSYFVGW